MLKLRNKTKEDYSFEGVKIPAFGVSDELTPEIHGRLLALSAGRILENYEEESTGIKEEAGTNPNPPVPGESKALQDFLKVPEKPTEKFLCTCGKEFDSARALKGHKVGAKHN